MYNTAKYSNVQLGTVAGLANATFLAPRNFTWPDGTTTVPSDSFPKSTTD